MATQSKSADTITAKFHQILIELLGIEEPAITADASISHDLGADELDIVEITMQCEDEFGITLDDEDVDKADTVGQFLKLLTKTIG